jgi:hypothetical protein
MRLPLPHNDHPFVVRQAPVAKGFREVMHIADDREDFVNIGKAAVRLPRIIS